MKAPPPGPGTIRPMVKPSKLKIKQRDRQHDQGQHCQTHRGDMKLSFQHTGQTQDEVEIKRRDEGCRCAIETCLCYHCITIIVIERPM
jgi:hypothetical protein